MAHISNLQMILRASVFFLALVGLSQAGTITIGPGADYDFETIQAGIDTANDGDAVLVAPGGMSSPSRYHFVARPSR